MRKLLVFTVIISSAFTIFGQKNISISGFVYDKLSGEILIGATVFDMQSKYGTVSNEYGFYSLTFPSQDSIDVYVSFIGYKQLNIRVLGNSKEQLDCYLIPGIELDAVTITATNEQNIVKRNETGVVRLQMKAIESLPNLFGEVDIIKAFQLTPGVQSGGEAKSNLYVRGGSPDQNLILLDDVPLYYVAHFGGFFSVFNADAINDVKLIKGGFPARYGSRLSSVLDIRMKEGNMNELSVQGTVGLLSSKISIEAPIIKNKMSLIVSARANILPIFRLMGTGLSYNFYDLNAKLNYRLSSKDKFFLSFYMGDDILSVNEKTDISKHQNKVKWGNTLVSFRWNHIYNNKLFSNLTFSNTYYRYKNIFEYKVETQSDSKSMSNTLLTGINDINFKMDFIYLLNPRYSLKFGANSIYHSFIPNDEHFSQSGTDIESINERYSSITNAFENAIYAENELKLKRINFNIGVRYSSYIVQSSNYNSFEPRVLLNYILRKDLSFKYSFSKMNQYIHLLTFSGTGIPSDYWMPTNENVKPETSIQNTFGIAKTFDEGRYEISIEAYHKTLDNLIVFKPGESLFGNLDTWENVVEVEGKGQNYGIELFLQKTKGKITGWAGVTVAKAERNFENVNNNKPYPFKYDRLLDLSFVVNYELKKNIILSATWTYGSGYPITLATEQYDINGEEIFVYDEKNSFRMRDYHRLDVAANFSKKTKWGERTWSISIFNLYNRQNPYYYYYGRELLYFTTSNAGGGYSFSPKYGELKLYQKSLFSIFPSFAYSFKF